MKKITVGRFYTNLKKKIDDITLKKIYLLFTKIQRIKTTYYEKGSCQFDSCTKSKKQNQNSKF